MERRENSLIPLIAACLGCVLLLACGETDEPVVPPPAIERPVNPVPDADISSSDGGGGGGASSMTGTVSNAASPKPELVFRLELSRSRFELGDEIPARLILENIGDRSIRILDPGRSLPADLTFKVETPDRRTVTIKEHQEIREQSITEEDLVSIAPGGRALATFDLGPTMRAAGHGRIGGYRLRTTFTGGYQGGNLTMEVWNRGRGKSLDAPLVLLTLDWPARLWESGVSPKVDSLLTKLLARVGRDGLPTQAARQELQELGGVLHPALVSKLAAATARGPGEQLIGWTAFYLLREAGEPALAALASSPEIAGSPIGIMLEKLIESDLRREANKSPSPADTRFLHLLLDPDRRPGVVIRLTRVGNEMVPGYVLTVNGDGSVRHERQGGPQAGVTSGSLPEKPLAGIFRTLADERVWLNTAARKAGTAGESLLVLEILKREPDGGAENPLMRLEVWETEAVQLNRSLSKVLVALGEARLALGH